MVLSSPLEAESRQGPLDEGHQNWMLYPFSTRLNSPFISERLWSYCRRRSQWPNISICVLFGQFDPKHVPWSLFSIHFVQNVAQKCSWSVSFPQFFLLLKNERCDPHFPFACIWNCHHELWANAIPFFVCISFRPPDCLFPGLPRSLSVKEEEMQTMQEMWVQSQGW